MQDRIAFIKALPIFASVVLTPIIMRFWSYASPAKPLSAVESASDLRRRNGWINIIFTLAMFVGLFSPVILFGRKMYSVGLPALGVAFGGSVIFPWVFVCAVTLPFGVSRYYEFWRFYELRYGIGTRGISVVYLAVAMIGVVSVFELFRRGIW